MVPEETLAATAGLIYKNAQIDSLKYFFQQQSLQGSPTQELDTKKLTDMAVFGYAIAPKCEPCNVPCLGRLTVSNEAQFEANLSKYHFHLSD